MFCDYAKIHVKAGDGGMGLRLRQKHVSGDLRVMMVAMAVILF